PLPATGPYMNAIGASKHVKRLVRNPRFREWSQAAQPDGYPDEIVFRLGVTPEAQVRALLRGKADGVLSEAPPERVPELAAQYPNRVHTDPVAQTLYLFLNTRVAPFNDVRVRRALNYAVDRKKLLAVAKLGQPYKPSCQILPPN